MEKGLRNYESCISSPPAIRTCLRMLLWAGMLLSMGTRITLDILDFTGRCMRKTALLWAQEAKGMSSAASPPNFLPFLRAYSACASRAISALLSSYSSLDGSDGLRRSFPTKIEKAVSHRDVDSREILAEIEIFGAIERNAVTGVGEPSKISGAHIYRVKRDMESEGDGVDAEPAAPLTKKGAGVAATWTPSFLLLPALSQAEPEFFIKKGRQSSKAAIPIGQREENLDSPSQQAGGVLILCDNTTERVALLEIFVSQKAKSREELYFSNTSKMASVFKSISIPNEEFSDDTFPCVAWKFLNEVKSTIVTLQRVVKQKMTLDIHNWSSSVHQEIHKIVKDKIYHIVNQVDARVQNFKIQFLKEAAKFVRDFKSLAKEADESLAKHKALEFEIERLLRAVISQDIMCIVQNPTVVDTSDLQTELERYSQGWINSSKTSRVDNVLSNKPVIASVRTKPITTSQPHVISQENMNSNSNGISSTGVESTAETRRPQPKSNTKNDRGPSASKSSCIKNKDVKVEENHMNLLLSKNKKHM
ncbi:hypothetical protein Tco_0422818 [Tanacetum coccineum]